MKQQTSVLYIRVPPELKQAYYQLSKSKFQSTNNYILQILLNHLEEKERK